MKIKICGLFRHCDIDFVNEARPDYIGFVFAESRRRVSFDTAREMAKNLIPSVTPVGVFANAPIADISRAYGDGVIRLAQLHGGEDEAYIRELKALNIPIIKAVRVNSKADILKWQTTEADFLLLDNGSGGTGTAFDWRVIPAMERPFFLAGGINSGNIHSAIGLKPYCIDIGSGAETDGVKDREKILDYVRVVREAF